MWMGGFLDHSHHTPLLHVWDSEVGGTTHASLHLDSIRSQNDKRARFLDLAEPSFEFGPVCGGEGWILRA